MTKDSVVNQVRDLLADPDVISAFDATFDALPGDAQGEICELNRYWRHQLSMLPVRTISERECLIDDIAPGDWVRHFRDQVLPTVRRFHLPTRG